MSHLSRLLAGLALLSVSACGFDFERKSTLLDRRILAIAAEPAEVMLGVTDLTQPVQFRALVADPKNPTEPQNFEWRWCVPTFYTRGNFDQVSDRCLETEQTLADRGQAPLSDLTLSLLPQNVVDVMQSNLGDLGNLIGGGTGTGGTPPDPKKTPIFTALLMAQLKVDDDSPSPLYGVKRIPLTTPGPGQRQPNKNPKLAAILFDGEPLEPGVVKEVKLRQCTADKKVSVVDMEGEKNALGQRPLVDVCEHRLTPVYDESQAEEYEAQTIDRDAEGNFILEKAKERLRFDWTITDNGSLSEGTTEEDGLIGPKEYDPLSTKWQEPPRLKGDTLKLWVVVRDGRGGESWEVRELKLVE